MTQRSISIAFQTDQPLAAYGALASAAEGYGFDGVSVYNDMLFQPAWLPLLEIARHTRRVRIGPAAINPFTCHPINIAGNIALLDEASQGRAYLGLARGAWLDFAGLDPPRPVTALREAFECVRHLLAQSHAPYAGTIFPLAGGDSLRWRILRPDIPFLLGAWGARAIRACAALVDEVKIGGTASPGAIRQACADIAAAAQAAGRDPRAIGVVAGAVTVVDQDGAAARALARRKAALYLPVIAELDRTLQLEPELLGRIKDAAAAYDFDRAARDISDDLLRRVAFAGTPAEVAAQAQALFAAGATRIEFGTPHGLSEESGMRLLGEMVLPGCGEAR
jgi:5,10-methylenetetrahydromethanopterin reductase